MKDKQMAGAGFGGPLLLSFTLIMTFITVGVKVSCLLRFTLAASSVAHKSPFGDSGLILCWSRIRKFVTYREYTDRQTDKESKYRGHSNPVDRQVERANT